MKIKKITLETEDGEKMEFEVKFPVSIIQQIGIRIKISLGMINEKEPNGLKCLSIISAPEHVLDYLKTVLDNSYINSLLNTR